MNRLILSATPDLIRGSSRRTHSVDPALARTDWRSL